MRPFRFGLVWSGTESPVEVARRAEAVGYSTLQFPDHTGMVSPLPAAAAAAAVTSTLRIGTQVINPAFRPLGSLAQDLAAIDIVSGGRLEVGLGAGYARAEVESLGLPFPSPGARVAEVARTCALLPRLFAGETVTEEPGPGRLREFRLDPAPPQGADVPIMVAGNRPRLLDIGARQAAIVQFPGFSVKPDGVDYSDFNEAALAERVARVTALGDPELGILVQFGAVADDPVARLEEIWTPGKVPLTTQQLLDSPFIQAGRSVGEIRDRLERLRAEYGISYFSIFDGRQSGFDAVVEELTGT